MAIEERSIRGGVLRRMPVLKAGESSPTAFASNIAEALAANTQWAPHSHPTHELLWNERGLSAATIDSRTWTISPHTALWIPAGTLHTGHAPKGTRYLGAYFDCEAFPSPFPGATAIELTPLLTLTLQRLLDQQLSESSRQLTQRMVIDLLTPAARPVVVRMPASPLLLPIAEALMQNPADPRGLAQWAREVGVNERTISRGFLAETGLNYSDWLAVARAQHALLLLGAGLAIEEVAGLTGYGSVNAFGTAFRRTTGMTPGQIKAMAA